MARRGENIYKRKDGRYEGRYIKRYDLAGKAVYGYIYSNSYREVKERLAKCKIDKTAAHTDSNMPLCKYLSIWLDEERAIKITTKQIYQSYIDNHINRVLGDIPLRKLNADLLQQFVNGLDLSPSTVKAIYSTLHSALAAAEEKELISGITRRIRIPKKEKSIVRVLTPSEQQRLEKALDEQGEIGVLICLYTGLRIGELCALRWSDIDFENAVLAVNGTQARTANGVEILSPKSRSSRREIPLPPFLLQKIQALPKESEFVLSHKGKPVDVRTYRRHFKSILEQAELPDIKYHSLRHTFATRALEVGMDYKTLSEILGHSTVSITLHLYAHSLKEHKRKQMDKLNQVYYS